MTKLHLTRHGETKWNIEKRFQGQHDSPLTQNGINQVKILSQYLCEIPLNAIYASSCNRAVITANIINADKHLPLHACSELQEIYLGAWEGVQAEEIKNKYPEDFHRFFYDPD